MVERAIPIGCKMSTMAIIVACCAKRQFGLHISFLFLIVFLGQLSFPEWGSAATNQNLAVQIQLGEARPLAKEVFGIHGSLLWSSVRYGDSELTKVYKQFGFTDIRMPGGTDANYYLSETGTYGCNSAKSMDTKSSERIKQFNAALSKKNRTYSTNDIVSFLKQSQTSFSLVVNVLCDTPANTLRWMKKLRDNGIVVKHVELGNEIYYEEYKWAFPSANDYIFAAKQHAQAVRDIFPQAEIGIVASSSSYRSNSFPDIEEMKQKSRYRRGLEFDRAATSAPFADKVILHIYSTIGTSKMDELLKNFNMAKSYASAISHFDTRFKGSIDYFHRLNPGKKIWITEWGLAFYGWQRGFEPQFIQSYYNGLFYSNCLLAFASSPEIDRTSYHQFTNLLPSPEGDMNSTAKIILALKEVILASDDIAPVNFIGVRNHDSTNLEFPGMSQEVSGAYFLSGNSGQLILVNKFDTSYSLGPIVSDKGAPVIAEKIEQLVPKTSPEAREIKMVQKSLAPGEQIRLPPFSITKIFIHHKPTLGGVAAQRK